MRPVLFVVLIILSELVFADTWSCTVEESKAVSENGRFGESSLSPAGIEPFRTFEVSTGTDPYVRGGPFNLPDEMKWTVLSEGGLNDLAILGFATAPVRNRYVLFSLAVYMSGDAKPFFATDGGGLLLYSGLCRQS
jgi:hypothetical protein